MNTDVVYEHLHIAYVGQWFLVAFIAVSFLSQRSRCSPCSRLSCCLLSRLLSRSACNRCSLCSGLSCCLLSHCLSRSVCSLRSWRCSGHSRVYLV